jgi:hypothetical protein
LGLIWSLYLLKKNNRHTGGGPAGACLANYRAQHSLRDYIAGFMKTEPSDGAPNLSLRRPGQARTALHLQLPEFFGWHVAVALMMRR